MTEPIPPIPNYLQKAKLGDIEFLARSIRTILGPKTVTHEFPGSNRRNVQNLGQLPDGFIVAATITGDRRGDDGIVVYGENYIEDLVAFKKLLSMGGPLDFRHTTQGTFKCKVVQPVILIEEDAEQGIAKFDFTLLTAEPQAAPRAETPNVGAVSNRTETVKRAVEENIEENYIVRTSFIGNLTDAINQINEISEEFLNNALQFTPEQENLSEFLRAVNVFRINAILLVQNPVVLGVSLMALFDSFDRIQLTAEAQVSSLSQLNRATPLAQLIRFFDFGDNDIPNRNDTAGLIQRTNNRDILRLAVQTGALAEAYREASLIDFRTTDDIDNVNDTLDAQYQKVKNQIDDPTKKELSLLRSDVRKLFDNQRLTASEVIELDLPPLPAVVQAHNLYGADALNRVDELIEVNGTVDTSTLGGKATKVLTT